MWANEKARYKDSNMIGICHPFSETYGVLSMLRSQKIVVYTEFVHPEQAKSKLIMYTIILKVIDLFLILIKLTWMFLLN